MGKTFQYKCSECGELHQGTPSFSFDAPAYYSQMSDKDRKTKTFKNKDLCVIDDEDFFVRAVLEIPIIGASESFTWGIWTTLSEENFQRYQDDFGKEDVEERTHFGWFSNQLPYYPETLGLKAQVHISCGKLRPWIELEHVEHPLCLDYHHGISWEKAIEIAQSVMHNTKEF